MQASARGPGTDASRRDLLPPAERLTDPPRAGNAAGNAPAGVRVLLLHAPHVPGERGPDGEPGQQHARRRPVPPRPADRDGHPRLPRRHVPPEGPVPQPALLARRGPGRGGDRRRHRQAQPAEGHPGRPDQGLRQPGGRGRLPDGQPGDGPGGGALRGRAGGQVGEVHGAEQLHRQVLPGRVPGPQHVLPAADAGGGGA